MDTYRTIDIASIGMDPVSGSIDESSDGRSDRKTNRVESLKPTDVRRSVFERFR